MSYRFTWDENKAASNIVDHQGITFDEASTVFDSPWRESLMMKYIPLTKGVKIIIGPSIKGRLLLICFYRSTRMRSFASSVRDSQPGKNVRSMKKISVSRSRKTASQDISCRI
ncbi:MAG: BrnT family toxin [Acidobacteria bacterium]|nr:BrnT family toxin [Acidobacteriota bacterium]